MIIVMCLCIPVPTGSQELHVSEPRSPAQVPAALSPPPTGQSEPQPTTTGVYIKLFVYTSLFGQSLEVIKCYINSLLHGASIISTKLLN